MRFRKWGDRPHWEYDVRLLGADDHGHWVGAPTGTPLARPGAAYAAPSDFVSLVPHDDAFVATFYRPLAGGHPGGIELYVDVTTVPIWTSTPMGRRVMTATDLDLDVLRGPSGRVWVDDEDEFARHRVRYGYPVDVVTLAARSCDRVRAGMLADEPPFSSELGRAWLQRLTDASVPARRAP